jgi:SAM-dependent methyltransferase
MKRPNNSFCPIGGGQGIPNRVLTGEELFQMYETYMGKPLPDRFKNEFFSETVTEYDSKSVGLRWYEPALPGNGDYYAFLARTFRWYYDTNRWDRNVIADWLQKHRPEVILDVACGDGETLEIVERLGLKGIGVELSEEAVAICRKKGLTAYSTKETDQLAMIGKIDVLLLLQVLEHVHDPVNFVRAQLEQFQPDSVIISVPCFTGLLGITSDPLSWPPHHATSWSEQGLRSLAAIVGLEVMTITFEACTLGDLHSRARAEPSGRLPGFAGWFEIIFRLKAPGISALGRVSLKILAELGCGWARCSHTVLGIFRPVQPGKAPPALERLE